MGGRDLGAAVGATARALLLAVLGVGLTAGGTPARVEIAELAAIERSEPAETDAHRLSPGHPPAGDDEVFAAPAHDGDDEPPVTPVSTPEGDGSRDPADATDTATTTPAETPGASVPPGAPEPTDSADPPASAETPSMAAEEPPADPIVAEIRLKLKDPLFRKGAAADDLAGLETFYAEHAGPPLWITTVGFNNKAQGLIAEIQKAPEWGLPGDAFDLPPVADLPATTTAQAANEIKLALAVLKYARYAKGGRVSPSLISNLFDQKSNLLDPRQVLRDVAASPYPGAYLVSLHPKHDQFERLRQLLGKAITDAKTKGRKPGADGLVQRIVVNMERWRWMPPDLGAYYVWNNIPAFTTRVMKHGKSIYVEKAIVGQLKYATPIFSSQMRSIVFNPAWVVPETIKTEDLQPRLRQTVRGVPDVAVLRENQLSVSYQGKPVDAATVDWGRVNIHSYTFTQAPGPSNVLGKLKFNFPNRHAIYMHDTVQRDLFKQAVRTLSHGCIRVHQPDRLAALLLAEDKGWSAQQVKAALTKGDNTGVVLSRPLPVHLTYFTMAYNGIGRLQTYADVYNLDAKMAQALFGTSEVHQIDSVAQPASAPRQQRRSASSGVRGPYLPGLFGN